MKSANVTIENEILGNFSYTFDAIIYYNESIQVGDWETPTYRDIEISHYEIMSTIHAWDNKTEEYRIVTDKIEYAMVLSSVDWEHQLEKSKN